LADGVVQAVHPGVAGPVPGWQAVLVVVVVGSFQAWHVQKINPADELAPTQDLPNETFDAGQAQAAFEIADLPP
jgi:hypothetical protein